METDFVYAERKTHHAALFFLKTSRFRSCPSIPLIFRRPPTARRKLPPPGRHSR